MMETKCIIRVFKMNSNDFPTNYYKNRAITVKNWALLKFASNKTIQLIILWLFNNSIQTTYRDLSDDTDLCLLCDEWCEWCLCWVERCSESLFSRVSRWDRWWWRWWWWDRSEVERLSSWLLERAEDSLCLECSVVLSSSFLVLLRSLVSYVTYFYIPMIHNQKVHTSRTTSNWGSVVVPTPS